MTNYLLLVEKGIAILLAITIAGILGVVFPGIASTAGGVIAATYFFSRYPWVGGKRPTTSSMQYLTGIYRSRSLDNLCIARETK